MFKKSTGPIKAILFYFIFKGRKTEYINAVAVGQTFQNTSWLSPRGEPLAPAIWPVFADR